MGIKDRRVLRIIKQKPTSKAKYNFEYMMNSCYAFNRDKGKCRVCKEFLLSEETHTHHIDPKLPLDKVNRVVNLASVHKTCHKLIHEDVNLNLLEEKMKTNVQKFREKLK
jgi:RNA-directed DNA polymerase